LDTVAAAGLEGATGDPSSSTAVNFFAATEVRGAGGARDLLGEAGAMRMACHRPRTACGCSRRLLFSSI
jgi:hypothetical protein